MKFNKLKEKMAGKIGRVAFKLKENSPTLFLIGGIGAIIGGTILACKATTKLGDILDEHEKDMDDIHECMNNPEFEEIYVESGDAKRETIKVYSRTIGKIAKGYAIPSTMIIGGIAMIIKSHNDLKGRYLGALSAFNALQTSFNDYRARVREELGEEEELHFYHGTKRIVEKRKVVGEDGKKKTESVVIDEYSDSMPSVYAVYFDETNPHWCSERQYGPCYMDYNINFIKINLSMWNNRLYLDKFVIFNDVLDSLGFKKRDVGLFTGWVDDGEHDGFINYDIRIINKENNGRFIDSESKEAILIDFNVDGNIAGKIDMINRVCKEGL